MLPGIVCQIVGSVLSPLLANIALDGLHDLLQQVRIQGSKNGRLGYVRYADDFVVVAPTRELLEQARPLVRGWLAERGLELSEEKTRAVHLDDGFDFLGFNLRRYGGKLLIKPQKEKVRALLRGLAAWLKGHQTTPQDRVIKHFNLRLWGWAAYYRHVCSKETFSHAEHHIHQMLWRWAKRRHPNKGRRWVKERYFPQRGHRRWVFAATTELRRGRKGTVSLYHLPSMPIARHVKVAGRHSPDDPALRRYWADRNARHGKVRYATDPTKQAVGTQQRWQCPVCHGPLFNGEPVDMHHRQPVSQGGTHARANLELRHEACHYNAHGRNE